MPRLVLPLVMAVLLLAVVAPAQAQTQDLPNPLGLRGYNLGMTLAEIRRLKFPDPTTDDVRLICTGDELSDEVGLMPRPDDKAGDVGITTCSFFAGAKGKVREVPMIVGGPKARVTFDITPKASDPAVSERLFHIGVEVKSDHFDDLEATYTAKFGPPHARHRTSSRDIWWQSRHADLAFLGRMDRLFIVYVDTDLYRLVDDLKKAKTKAGADKL